MSPLTRPIEITCSQHFLAWLAQEQISLAFTTYQTNRLFLIGRKADGALSTFERIFDRPMGLFAQADRLYVGCRYQIWQLDNSLPPGTNHNGYDALYVPRRSYTTGDVDIHDLRVDAQGRLLFVNTLYSCLATVSERYSFAPIWQPPFISKLAPEDRCHLNGLSLADGEPRYVTAVSRSDVFSGWRRRRESGGLLMDIQSNQILLDNLSMPHSPRLHEGKLWLLNAGSGDLGYVELPKSGGKEQAGGFQPVAFCPGFARGLAFHKQYAIVGLSKPRRVKAFEGLSLDGKLSAADADAICGLAVIDTVTGNVVHWLEVEGIVNELYDVAVLPNVVQPMALGFRSDEISRFVTIDYPNAQPVFQTLNPSAETVDTAPIDFLSQRTETTAADPNTPQPEAPRQTAKPSPSPYRLQRSLNLSVATLLQEYSQLTFPPIHQQLRGRMLREPLAAVVARQKEETVGLALAEIGMDGASAAVRSWFVIPACRRQGLGTQLLASLASGLAQAGLKSLDLPYATDWPSAPLVEQILNKYGWSSPQTSHDQYKVNMAELSQASWLDDAESALPAGFDIIPWTSLTSGQRAAIQQKGAEMWFPVNLNPFQAEDYLAFNSLALRRGEEIVGWMVTHLPAPDRVQYTSFFVSPEYRGSGVALSLLAASLHLHLAAEIPYAIFQVDSENQAMRAFVNRYLAAYVTKQSERRVARKALTPGR